MAPNSLLRGQELDSPRLGAMTDGFSHCTKISFHRSEFRLLRATCYVRLATCIAFCGSVSLGDGQLASWNGHHSTIFNDSISETSPFTDYIYAMPSPGNWHWNSVKARSLPLDSLHQFTYQLFASLLFEKVRKPGISLELSLHFSRRNTWNTSYMKSCFVCLCTRLVNILDAANEGTAEGTVKRIGRNWLHLHKSYLVVDCFEKKTLVRNHGLTVLHSSYKTNCTAMWE
jgi:hypothetical protein